MSAPAAAPRSAATSLGTAALEDGRRVDFARLRAERRSRLLAAMAAEGLDALVLGREANARYAAGARRLWTAGSRPFGPGCVVVAATEAVHLLSTWDDGIPPEVTHDQLFGITWNGAHLFGALQAIPGLGQAGRVGVDGMSPGMGQLLAGLVPGGELVDATPMLLGLRRHKTVDELLCIRTAVAVAEGALAAAVDDLRPGATARGLAARATRRMAELGVTTPDVEPTFGSASPAPWPGSAPRPAPIAGGTDQGFDEGELVDARLGVLYAGYQGMASGTWACGRRGAPDGRQSGAARALSDRWLRLAGGLAEAARPGNDGRAFLDVYSGLDEPLPEGLVAHGVGLGLEPPLIGRDLPADAGAASALEPGMVLFVAAAVADPLVGRLTGGQVLEITGDRPEVLSRLGSGGPFAGHAD